MMLFVFDENFSKRLAEGLHLLEKSNPGSLIPVSVTSTEVLMGKRGATDEEIIKKMGKNGILITKDKDFKYIKLLRKVIEETEAKVIFFKSSKSLIFFWDILTAIVKRWEEMKEVSSREVPPYVYEFDIRLGIKECHF